MTTSKKYAVVLPDGPNYVTIVSLHDTYGQASKAIERSRRHDSPGNLTQSGTFLSVETVSADAKVNDRFRCLNG
jgi:hypothetical protein